MAGLPSGARRGRSSSPHDPLLDGQPPLEPAGRVSLVEFYARRPFHPAGKWLAAMGTSELAYVAPQRRALADAGWDRVHGDRHTALTALVCGADPDEIHAALSCALLTDAEMDTPAQWADYGDPFEDWSETDCTTDDLVSTSEDGERR